VGRIIMDFKSQHVDFITFVKWRSTGLKNGILTVFFKKDISLMHNEEIMHFKSSQIKSFKIEAYYRNHAIQIFDLNYKQINKCKIQT